MASEIHELLDYYTAWIRDKTTVRQIEGWVEITTPYIDRHNDYLQIYASQQDDGFLLTDDGYTLEDLEQSGCKLNTAKRKDLLETTLNGFGVKLDDNALMVRASTSNFPLQKHNLVQAMLAVNDLFYLAAPSVASLFLDDVALWLDTSEVRYTPRVKLTGDSGYDHVFDFVIPKSKTKPERLIRAVNRPDRNTAEAIAFAWVDTKKARPRDSQAYVFLNDSTRSPSKAVREALRQYELRPVAWSERESVRQELAA